MTRSYQPLYWFDAPHPWRPLPVYWMDDDSYPLLRSEHPTGGECYAFFCEETWRILLWAGMRKHEMEQIVLHELGHACWSEDDSTRISGMAQEKALQNIQVSLSETLRRSGWKLPALPDGYRSLATHARWLRYGKRQRSAAERACDT